MTIRLSPEAGAELEVAFDYYQGRREGLGHRFLDEYVLAARAIAEAPNRWPVDASDSRVRRCRLDVFPFSLVYQVAADHCTIIAVANAHRRPGYWRNRLA
jgi:hypothetical protein